MVRFGHWNKSSRYIRLEVRKRSLIWAHPLWLGSAIWNHWHIHSNNRNSFFFTDFGFLPRILAIGRCSRTKNNGRWCIRYSFLLSWSEKDKGLSSFSMLMLENGPEIVYLSKFALCQSLVFVFLDPLVLVEMWFFQRLAIHLSWSLYFTFSIIQSIFLYLFHMNRPIVRKRLRIRRVI